MHFLQIKWSLVTKLHSCNVDIFNKILQFILLQQLLLLPFQYTLSTVIQTDYMYADIFAKWKQEHKPFWLTQAGHIHFGLWLWCYKRLSLPTLNWIFFLDIYTICLKIVIWKRYTFLPAFYYPHWEASDCHKKWNGRNGNVQELVC